MKSVDLIIYLEFPKTFTDQQNSLLKSFCTKLIFKKSPWNARTIMMHTNKIIMQSMGIIYIYIFNKGRKPANNYNCMFY